SQQAATRNRGKAIVNSHPLIYDQEPSVVTEDNKMSEDKEIDKLMALISEYGHVAKECQKSKWAKDATYHKEKMLLCKQEEVGFQLNTEQADWKDDTDDEPEDQELEAHYMYIVQIQEDEAGIQLNAEQTDWKDDTDDESDDQELEAHYMYMAKLQQVSPDAVDSGPIFDKEPEQKVQTDDHYDVFDIELDMNYDSEQIDQNAEDADLTKERELLASLIEKLKCEIDETKNRNTIL
nr:hypothetical protein [Tanacetum cinerariifolium]